MVEMLIYNREPEEKKHLIFFSKDATADLSEEQLDFISMEKAEEVEVFLENSQGLDLACMDVKKKVDISLLRELRKRHEDTEILLVADLQVSPMEYLTPDIRAASLLIRPFQEEQCRQIVKEFFHAFYRARENSDTKKVLMIENREGKVAIPFHQIYYIEVRERKIFVRLLNKEYSQYDSLEHIMEHLPENFLRCHRSFIFNIELLETVKLSENAIYLKNDIMVPLSRSYKPEIKEYLNGLRGN